MSRAGEELQGLSTRSVGKRPGDIGIIVPDESGRYGGLASRGPLSPYNGEDTSGHYRFTTCS